MHTDLLGPLGKTLRARRHDRKMTQPMLAKRVGRSTPRISDLERDLLAGRVNRDRLGLLAEVCDALDLVPVLVPRERAQAVQRALGVTAAPSAGASPGRVFDDMFVDLSEDEDAPTRPEEG